MRILAVDGGASTTRALVVDESVQVLGWGSAGPSNHLYGEAGRQRLKKALAESVTAALPTSTGQRPITCACLGMTGVREGSQESQVVEDTLRSIVDCEQVLVYGDTHTALAGASGGEPGILVYSGTGSVSFGVNPEGTTARAGGWGYLIDDEGSGYWIGLEALKAVFRELDGRSCPTAMRAWLLEHLQAEGIEHLRRVIYTNDGMDRPSIAKLTVVVARAAEKGDEAALQILAGAAAELAQLAIVVAQRLETAGWHPVVYTSGGVFRMGRALVEPFRERVLAAEPSATIRPARYSPLVGGVLMAASAASVALAPAFLGTLSSSAARHGLSVAP